MNLNSGHNGSNETHHYCPIPLPSRLSLSLCIYPPPLSRKHDLRAERSGQRSRPVLSIVPRINRRIHARHQKSILVLVYERLIEKLAARAVAITDFPAPPGDALTFQVVTNVGLTRWIDNVDAKRVFIDVLRHDDAGGGGPRPVRFTDHGLRIGLCNVVLIAPDQSLINASPVNNR